MTEGNSSNAFTNSLVVSQGSKSHERLQHDRDELLQYLYDCSQDNLSVIAGSDFAATYEGKALYEAIYALALQIEDLHETTFTSQV